MSLRELLKSEEEFRGLEIFVDSSNIVYHLILGFCNWLYDTEFVQTFFSLKYWIPD